MFRFRSEFREHAFRTVGPPYNQCRRPTRHDITSLWFALEHSLYVYLNINQLDALNFIMSLFHASTCFEHHVLIVRRSELYYTASGIITPVGGRPVHRLREEYIKIYWDIYKDIQKYIEMHGQQNILKNSLYDYKLQQRCRWVLQSSGMLNSVFFVVMKPTKCTNFSIFFLD